MIQDTKIDIELSQETINALENITEDQFKYLISTVTNIDKKYISIKEINNVVYYHNNNIVSYNTQDDIYTNGSIRESEYGKMIKDFTVSVIVKRNFNMPKNLRVVGLDIILNANSDENMKILKRDFILKYLTPGTLQLLV